MTSSSKPRTAGEIISRRFVSPLLSLLFVCLVGGFVVMGVLITYIAVAETFWPEVLIVSVENRGGTTLTGGKVANDHWSKVHALMPVAPHSRRQMEFHDIQGSGGTIAFDLPSGENVCALFTPPQDNGDTVRVFVLADDDSFFPIVASNEPKSVRPWGLSSGVADGSMRYFAAFPGGAAPRKPTRSR
jgi:hypothetical protein